MLRKLLIVAVTPGSPGVEGRAASMLCTQKPPVVAPPPPISQPATSPKVKYLYVPSHLTPPYPPVIYETRTPYYGPNPPAGYHPFVTGVFFVPDPAFPNGQKPVYETRAYWNYP